MSGSTGGLAWLLATDAPALPAPWVMQLGLTLGWALVLALLGAVLAWRQPLKAQRLIALLFALWTLLPGPISPDYWLGLAFHAPSLTAMLWCGWGLLHLLRATNAGFKVSLKRRNCVESPGLPLLVISTLLGYALLMDTFAMFPITLYAWGFSPALLITLLSLALLPWIMRGGTLGSVTAGNWIVPCALILFAATRLPTGNLWDALIDPWLWLLLQVVLIRRLLWSRRGRH